MKWIPSLRMNDAENASMITEMSSRWGSMRNRIEWITYWIYEWIVLWREDLSWKGILSYELDIPYSWNGLVIMDAVLCSWCMSKNELQCFLDCGHCVTWSIARCHVHRLLRVSIMHSGWFLCRICLFMCGFVMSAFHNSIMKISSSNYPRTWWTQ